MNADATEVGSMHEVTPHKTRFITSHLVLSDGIPTTISGLRLRAETPTEAVKIIKAGGTAVLPADDFDGAAAVLRMFGADEEHIAWQVHAVPPPGSPPFDEDNPFPLLPNLGADVNRSHLMLVVPSHEGIELEGDARTRTRGS